MSLRQTMTFWHEEQYNEPVLTLNGVPVENVDLHAFIHKSASLLEILQSHGTITVQKTQRDEFDC